MIRLGSLAGYPFEGPRVLAGWTAPAIPGVYAVLYRPEPAGQQYAVMYVGHSEDLSTEPFPFKPSHAAELATLSGVVRERMQIVDGEKLSWLGSRTPSQTCLGMRRR